MNREIKFRVWDGKKILYFDNMCFDTDGPTTTLSFWLNDEEHYRPDLTGSNFPIMQYTGLRDKNGKEIYEGDIVRENTEAFGKSELNYVVGFKRGHFTLTETGSGYDKMGIWNVNTNMEVIGNIYQNPELLKNI